jgi:hypothetical protein
MQTYSGMAPYILGFHLTIDGWRDNRLETGWRTKTPLKNQTTSTTFGGDNEEMGYMEAALGQPRATLGFGLHGPDPPTFVKAVARLLPDLKALQLLTSGDKPPLKRA